MASGARASELAVEPLAGPVDADVRLPGSKSITNRALVCSAFAAGTSTLRGALRADDTVAMAGCLAALGAQLEGELGADAPLVVRGTGGVLRAPTGPLDAAMSGTTARFLLPVLAAAPGPVTLTGHPQLLGRPMAASIEAVRHLGATVTEQGERGHLPVTVAGSGVAAAAGRRLELAGDVSSQFLSGLLLAGPLLGGLEIDLTTPLVSRPYVDMTMQVQVAFGAEVGGDDGCFRVAPGGYRATDFGVEPDASAASYFFAAAAVAGGRVRVEGLGGSSTQGDLRFVEVLEAMGCEVTVGEAATEVRGTGRLAGVDVDLADLSDTAPTLAVVAAFAGGPTRARGIGFIRRKETDRIAAIVAELRRCGVDAEEEADGFVVRPAGPPRPARIETYDDHRMAMSFAVLGLRTPGTVIADPGCVSKTFPDYFETLRALH